jgi:O-antigen ligase
MIDINAVYMAWYTFFSLSLLLLFPWAGYIKNHPYIRVLLLTFQFVFFILLSSKTLILLFFILLVPFFIGKTRWRLANWKVVVSALVFTALFVGLFTTENPIRRRYEDIVNKNDIDKAWLKDYREVDESQFSNLAIRVMVWRMGIENMRAHNLWLTGAGNGDVQDMQNQRMASYHVQNWDKSYFDNSSTLWNLDLHNMYLETLLMIGIPGLVLFLLIMFNPLIYIKKTDYRAVFIIFFVVAILFMMQEASLQTQAGIIYYTFFAQIFWNIYYSAEQEKNMRVNILESKKNEEICAPEKI